MKVGFLILGCRVNHYESEALAELLQNNGFEIVSPENADAVIVNTCAVTSEAVRKSGQMVRRFSKKGVYVGVMGCASQLSSSSFSKINGVGFVCGTRNKLEIVDALKKWRDKNETTQPSIIKPDTPIEKMNISHFDRTRAYVKIQDGCNNRCSYCIISELRGKSVSRQEDDILAEIGRLASNGCHEVVLTGIETASYGKALPELIEKTAKIDGIERIRLGSMEPSFLNKSFADGVCQTEQFMHHIHVSVQSGSSSVLARMRRKYNREQLINNLNYLKSVMPDINFTADIIVGFPGETYEEFNDTLSLVKEIGFLHCHIFKYSKRPGTPAAEMDCQVPSDIVDNRFDLLSKEAENAKLKIFKKAIDEKKPIEVLAETTNGKYVFGHSREFMECKVISTDFEKGEKIYFLPESVDNDMLLGKEVRK